MIWVGFKSHERASLLSLRSAAVLFIGGLFIGGGGGGGAAALIPHSVSHSFRARARPAPPTIKFKK